MRLALAVFPGYYPPSRVMFIGQMFERILEFAQNFGASGGKTLANLAGGYSRTQRFNYPSRAKITHFKRPPTSFD
jgi:hypothetical protein